MLYQHEAQKQLTKKQNFKTESADLRIFTVTDS